LTFFTKFDTISQNHVQSYSFDVPKGLDSSNTIKYIKRISLESHGSTPSARNTWVAALFNSPQRVPTRHSELHQNRSPCFGCSLSGTSNFSPKIPVFDPLDPKPCTLVYKNQKSFKRRTNIES